MASQFRTSLILSATHRVKDVQPHVPSPTQRRTTPLRASIRTSVAHWAIDYTVSPTLTVQLYAQPFVSKAPTRT